MNAGSRVGFWLVVCIVICFIAATVTMVEWRYLIFRNDVDLGIFTQVVAGIGSGFSSTAEGGVNHLLVHWSPLIVLGWPFLRFFGPSGLEIFQALLISLTLFPIWGMARARFAALQAAGITAVCALYPILCANAVGDFHEMAFVPVLSATLVYALDRRRYALGVLAAVLLACTKEDQFVVLAFNGLTMLFLAKGDAFERRFGQSVALVAGAGAAIYFGIVRNVLQPHVTYASLHFYNWSENAASSSFGQLVIVRVKYVLQILAPLVFLPLNSRYGLFLIPGFVEVLASHEPVTVAPGAHYSALLSGYAMAAFVDGIGRLSARLRVAGASAAVVLAVAIAVFASPMEYWYYLYRLPNAHDAQLQRTIDSMPRDADIGTEDEIFSHMGLDPNASIDLADKQWILFDRTHYSDKWRLTDEPVVRKLLAQRRYTVIGDRNGIVLLRKR